MLRYLMPLLALLAASATAAQTQDAAKQATLPSVSLSANATRTVQNDIATASLFVEKEDTDAAVASEAVTLQANKAHALLKDFSGLKVKTANRQAYPVWDKNRVTRWRVRHELLVEGADFNALSKAIGTLQPHAQLGGIRFSVSSKLREATENQLIQQASADFQKRADLVSSSFGAKAYRIKEIAVHSGEPSPIMPFRAQAMVAAAESTPPVLEGGSNEISVTISGSIELVMP